MNMRYYFTAFALSIGFCMVFPLEAHAGRRFDELVRALQSKKITQIMLQEVAAKHVGKNIEGRAYIVNIGDDVSGVKVVTLCTEKSTDHPKAVTIVVYLRKHFEGNLLRFKAGDRRYCFGPFKEIRMGTIIIEGGFIK